MGRCHEAHRPSTHACPSKRSCTGADGYPGGHEVTSISPFRKRMAVDEYRTDKKQHFSEKVTKVESILAADSK